MRTPPMPARRRRVPAMAPEDRRAALIEATVPLLRAHGTGVSTRQIAEAAGIAEGTIFRVFPDKSSLLRAAALSAFDPAPTLLQLDDIDPDLPLRDRLKAMAAVLAGRIEDVTVLAGVLRTTMGAGDPHEFMTAMTHSSIRVREAVAARLSGDESLLRRDPAVVAFLLSSMLSASLRGFRSFVPIPEPVIGSDEIVDLLLDGLLKQPDHTTTEDMTRC